MIKAQRIQDIYKAFDPAPLTSPSELHDFYVDDLNALRGSDKIKALALGLKRQHSRGFYKAFVMGHAGVGISTELSRLEQAVRAQFRTFRLSANTDLDPVNFKPFDVILRVALGLAEETAKPVKEGGAGSPLPEALDAREVGTAAAFLASSLASGITGTTLYVDKGFAAMGKAV
jgi:hypothetical protein